jgi:hypothetical protein
METLADSMYGKPMLNENLPAQLGALRWDSIPIAARQGLRLTVLRLDPVVRQAILLMVGGRPGVYDGRSWAGGTHLWPRESGRVQELLVESDGPLVIQHTWREPPGPGSFGVGVVRGDVDYTGMLVLEETGRRVYRCNNGVGEAFDELVFALELVAVEELSPEFLARAERAKQPVQHSGKMLNIGGKRPVPVDLVEVVVRYEQGDRVSFVGVLGARRMLNKGVSCEEAVRAIGEEEFAYLARNDELGEVICHLWIRRSAVTGLYPMKSTAGTLLKLRSDGPYLDEEDDFEPGLPLPELTLEEAERVFGRG